MITLKQIEEFEEIINNSTPVVKWYAHSKEVRGPFGRWFVATEVDKMYEHHVGELHNDCLFAATAMNMFYPLLQEVKELRKKLNSLVKQNKE